MIKVHMQTRGFIGAMAFIASISHQTASAGPADKLVNGRPSRATYEVPAGEYLPESYVVNLSRAHFQVSRDQAYLDYELPRELDGTTPHRFRLTGTRNGNEWHLTTNDSANSSGQPSAEAVCVGSDRDFSCHMTYAKNDEHIFPLDTESADRYLQTRPDLSPTQLATIKQAQFALSHEPIGIVRGLGRRRSL